MLIMPNLLSRNSPGSSYVSKRDKSNICVCASSTLELEDFVAALVNQS